MPKKKTALAPHQKAALSPYQNHAYINPDGTVDGEKLLNIVRKTPGAFDLIIASQVLKGKDDRNEFDVSELISGISNLLMLALHGDDKSAIQLKAIEKLIKPAKYELPFTKIRELIDKYETSPILARGWELRRIMSSLCAVVEPLRKEPPHSPDQRIKMQQSPLGVFVGLSDLARSHLKRNSTLQSVAISIYLEQLRKQGITDESSAITEKTLKADLARVREWEVNASEEDKLRRAHWLGGSLDSDHPIIWYEFSEGWKKRKKARKRPLLKS
jgi:hypothetical protein